MASFLSKPTRARYVFLVDGLNTGPVLRKRCVSAGTRLELEGSRHLEGCRDELDVSRVRTGSVCRVATRDRTSIVMCASWGASESRRGRWWARRQSGAKSARSARMAGGRVNDT